MSHTDSSEAVTQAKRRALDLPEQQLSRGLSTDAPKPVATVAPAPRTQLHPRLSTHRAPARSAAAAGRVAGIAGLYDLHETIGRGHYAVVKAATRALLSTYYAHRHVFTGERVAVKCIEKHRLENANQRRLAQEVICMKLVQHPNIVRLYEVIDTATKLYLVQEIGAGDLFDYIMKHSRGLEEDKARDYFLQIVRAIAYCHQLHVVHRDLKPENVVFFPQKNCVKVSDFGFSQCFEPGTKLDTSCGSLCYSAPEILLGDSYDAPSVDVWSLGVILYMLVCGRAPFQEANESETITMILDCSYRLPENVSDECKALIKRLLVREPKRRALIIDILSDPWLRSKLQPEELEVGFARAAPLVRTQKLTDEESEVIVGTMVEGGIAASREELEASLASDGYDHLAATYYLLAEKLLRDQRSRASGAPTPSLERAHGPNSTGVEQGSLRHTAAQQQQGSNKNSPTSPTDQNANLTARSPTEQSDEDSQQNFAPRRCSLIREESVTDEEPSPSRVNSAMLGKNKHKQASMQLMRESSLSISKEAADILANARAARDSVHLQKQDGSPDSMPSCDTSPMHHKQVNLNVDVNIDEAALDALVASHGCAVDAILEEEGSSQEEMNVVPAQSATATPGDDQVFTVHAADENLSVTTPAQVAETQAQMLPPSSAHQSMRTTSAPIVHVQPQRKLGTAAASTARHRSSAQSTSATLNLNLNVNLETGGRGSITPNSGSARPIALSKPRSHSLTRSPRGSMASSSGLSAQHRLSAKLENTNTAGSVHSAGGVGVGVVSGAKKTCSEVLVVEGAEAGEPIHMHRSRSEGGVLLTTMGPATTRDASCPACGHTIAGRGLSGGHQISIGLSIRAHTPTRDEFLARSSTTPCAFPSLALRSSASPNVNASRANGSANGSASGFLEKEQQRPIVRAHALRLSLPASHGTNVSLLRPPTQAAAAADLLSRSASSSAFSCKSDSGVRYERSGTTSPVLTPTSHINVIKPYEGSCETIHEEDTEQQQTLLKPPQKVFTMDDGDESKRSSFGPVPTAPASANPTPFHKSSRLRPPTSKTKSKQHQKLEGLSSGGGVCSLPTPSLGVSRQHSALTPRSASLVPPAGGATTTSNASGTSSLSCSNYSLRSLLRISDYAVLSVQQRLHVNTIDRARTTDDAPSTAAATAKNSRRGSFSSIALDAPPERKSSFDSLVERRRSLFRGLHDPAQRRSISADDESATPSTAAAQSPAHEIPAATNGADQVTHNSQTDAPVARVSTGAAGDAVGPSTVRPMARIKGRLSEPRLSSRKFRPIGCDHSISIDEENSTDALNDAGSPSLFSSSQLLQLRRDTIETQATAGDAATPLLGKREGSSPRHSPKGEHTHADAKCANGQRSRQNSKSGGGLLARVAALFCIGRCVQPFHRHSSRSRNSPSGQPLSPRERGATNASTRLD